MKTNKTVEFTFMDKGDEYKAITAFNYIDTLDNFYSKAFVLVYDTEKYNIRFFDKISYKNSSVCTDNSMINELRFQVSSALNIKVPKAENIKIHKS